MSLEISLKNLRKEILKPKQTYLGCNQLNEIKKSLSFDKDFLLLFRAEDEGRTRDIQLGRLTLYQLSYFRVLQFLNLCIDFPRAEDEGRTRDIQLGRLTLYQLSYFRILRFLNLRIDFLRAEDEGRTRDIQLGRLTLYQLSYFRIFTIFKSSY